MDLKALLMLLQVHRKRWSGLSHTVVLSQHKEKSLFVHICIYLHFLMSDIMHKRLKVMIRVLVSCPRIRFVNGSSNCICCCMHCGLNNTVQQPSASTPYTRLSLFEPPACFFRLQAGGFKLRVRGTLRVRFEVSCVNIRQTQYIRGIP